MSWLRVWICAAIGWIGLSTFADANEADSPEMYFQQAVTWYRLARATQNDHYAHQRAEALYQKVIDSPLASTELKQQAVLGLNQTTYRLDNSHDTYRTLFDPVWWMTKSDSTVEWYGDPYMLALGNAYAAVEAHWEREMDPENHAVIVLVSRNPKLTERVLDTDGETDQQEEIDYRLSLMRDELIGLADATPSIVGVPDDLFPISISWLSNPTLSAEEIAEVATRVGTQGVVVFRAIIDDEIAPTDTNLGIVRISLSTDFWRLGEDKPYATLKSVGLGQSTDQRRGTGFLWVILIFAMTLLGSQIYARKVQDVEPVSSMRAVLVGAFCFLIGGGWVNIAISFAADYQVDWGQASFWLENDIIQLSIPYLPSFQWIIIFGFVALVGPMLILVWAQSKAAVILQAFVPEKYAQIPLFLPMMSAGVLGWMFLPLVIAEPEHGFMTALPIVLITQGLIFVTLPSFTKVLEASGDLNFHLTNVVAGSLGLGLFFSIGLFNGLEWLSFCLSIPLMGWMRFRKESSAFVNSDEKIELADVDNPFQQVNLIAKEEGIVEAVYQAINESHSALIRRDDAITTGRLFRKLSMLSFPSNHKVIHLECSSVDNEPFVAINRLFEILGLRTYGVESEGDNFLADGVDTILTGLPGVEFVMGLIDTGNSNMSQEVMIQDAAAFLVRHLNVKSTLVLCVENAHWMDAASQEVLLMVMEMISSEAMFIVVWDSSATDDLVLNQLKVQGTIYESELLSYEEEDVRAFASEYMVDLPDTIYDSLVHQIFHLSEKNIQRVQGLFEHLYAKDFLAMTVDNTIVATEQLLNAKSLKSVLPSSYRIIEQQKLGHFTEEQQTLLKLASACGDVFYAAELAAGLNVSKLEVLQQLMLIEQTIVPSIIVDVPNARNIFQFRLSLTQQIFEEYLYYDLPSQGAKDRTPNELAHHYFEQIVDAGLNQEIPEVPVNRLIQHAEKLGSKALGSMLVLTVQHFKTLTFKCALQDIIDEYKVMRPRFQPFATSFEVVQLDLMYASAVKRSGGGDAQSQAIDILSKTRAMIQYLSVDEAFDFIKEWCDIGYSGVNDKTLLAHWKQQAIDELSILPNVSKWYVESYILTADRYLLQKKIANDLLLLVASLKETSVSPDQQYALGRILKEAATARWQEWSSENAAISLVDKREFFMSEIQPMFTEAVAIMRQQNDFVGVAIAYGQEGGIHLYQIQQYAQAIDLFIKDLEIVQEYHQVDVEAVTYNRLSMAYLNIWKEQWADLDNEFVMTNWREAHHNVLQSLSVAKQRKRTIDIIFSVNHLTDVLMAREVWRHSNVQEEKFSSFQQAVEALNLSWDVVLEDLNEISAEVLAIDWGIISNPGFRTSVQQRWKEICADCSGVEWVQALAKRLD